MIIAVLNLKGRAGKTMLAVNLPLPTQLETRVLLVDADPHGSTTAWSRAREQVTDRLPREQLVYVATENATGPLWYERERNRQGTL